MLPIFRFLHYYLNSPVSLRNIKKLFSEGKSRFRLEHKMWFSRDVVWDYLKNCYQIFVRGNSNATFSDIFSITKFPEINDLKKSLFISSFEYNFNCAHCQHAGPAKLGGGEGGARPLHFFAEQSCMWY